MMKHFAIIIVVALAIKALIYLLRADTGLGFGCSGDFQVPLPALVCNGIQFIVGFVILYKFRRIKDDYGASHELIVVSGMWIVATVVEVVALMVASSSLPTRWGPPHNALTADTFGVVHGYITLIRCIFLLFATLAWPLYQTYTVRFVSLWSDYSALSSLKALLSDIVCIQYFRAFLLHEQMSSDYLSCWVEIELFNDLARSLAEGEDDVNANSNGNNNGNGGGYGNNGSTSGVGGAGGGGGVTRTAHYSAQLRPHAARIFDKFLAHGAEREVRLVSDAARHKVVVDINKNLTSKDSFSIVQDEIFAVMNSSFPRFKSSPFHKQCLSELERDEQLRSVLERSGMIDPVGVDNYS